ncbi:putative NlpC/P60-like cell-wall peptidase [Choiromyces venosus 120613-1]|uniref:Putative NlpC/P60-like cell-wall peptidase n=1 Tax=Choiromyces venosus 120613-1 TaxID=1336337 RepID=A0A3N4J4C3_9PEZI|nr:putative NlpC/P60-like cell-wall peptidase [Choiromyces venosus 120613-1]
MKSIGAFTFILSLAVAAGASPVEQIFGRAVGDKCSGPAGNGTYKSTSKCDGISYQQAFCPNDPDGIQCCVEIPCKVSAGTGFCRSLSHGGCSGGTFHAGTGAPWPCPGSSDIQCCVKPPATENPPNPPSSSEDVGAKILAKALTAAGTPYAWGGGSCSGPSEDQPPYKYGDIGYDCSGLLCWAVCQVTGRDLFKAGLRVTYSMYCASDATLSANGMRKVEYAQRRAGDAVFFGNSCDCAPGRRDSIHHVGIMMDSGTRMWNAPNDRINKVIGSNIANFGETPCPKVVRFS